MAYKKYAKKGLKKAGRYVKKRYFKGKGYTDPKISTMARDVMRLKQMINAEKQNVETAVTNEYDLAQYNGVSTSGSRVLAGIMPPISQGVGEDNRKGDSLKICSWVLKLQVYNNGNDTLSGVNYKFYVVRQPVNPPSTTSDTMGDFLEPNPFSGVIDYYSNRNYQHYKDFVVMGVIEGKLKANESQDAGQGSKTNVHTLARKQEFHIRYDKGTTDVLNNKIYLIAVASDGDRSTQNQIFFKYSAKFYFYDN
jgi:hypothetical protein